MFQSLKTNRLALIGNGNCRHFVNYRANLFFDFFYTWRVFHFGEERMRIFSRVSQNHPTSWSFALEVRMNHKTKLLSMISFIWVWYNDVASHKQQGTAFPQRLRCLKNSSPGLKKNVWSLSERVHADGISGFCEKSSTIEHLLSIRRDGKWVFRMLMKYGIVQPHC